MEIKYIDTDGTKGILPKATLGYDDYTVGGDSGRIAVGTGTENIYIAKKEEVDQVADDALAVAIALG